MTESIPRASQDNKVDFDQLFDTDTAKQWLLFSSPYPVLSVLLIYLLVVLKIGPDWMKTRQAYELKTVLRVYNLLLVSANLFLVLRLVGDPRLFNVLIFNSCSIEEFWEQFIEDSKTLPFYTWLNLVLKLMDLFDTVIMVMRKKFSHVTFLHVYHHTAMVFFTWFTIKYAMSHVFILPVWLNSLVHSVMYSYYLLATYPSLKRYLWWKKHLTKLQLGQFAVVFVYLSIVYYKHCYIPPLIPYIWMFNVTVFAVLFMNFYYKTYLVNNNKNE